MYSFIYSRSMSFIIDFFSTRMASSFSFSSIVHTPFSKNYPSSFELKYGDGDDEDVTIYFIYLLFFLKNSTPIVLDILCALF